MSARNMSPYIYLILAASVFFISCGPEKKVKDRPHILLIMADDMGYSDIEPFGGEIPTPALNRLAQEGLKFTQFYNTGRCCPTRGSLLTGLYPTQCGMGTMADNFYPLPGYEGYLTPNTVTIAQVLKQAGYSTYHSGKWHVGTAKKYWPYQLGFDKSFGLINGASSYFTDAPYRDTTWRFGREIIFFEDSSRYRPGPDFYMTRNISEKAVEYIREHEAGNPFFMYVAYTAPHWPLHALPEDIEKYEGKYLGGWDSLREVRYRKQLEMNLFNRETPLTPRPPQVDAWDSLGAEEKAINARKRAVYAAMIDRMDQGIGNIMAALEARGWSKNTLVAFFSDNGADRSGGVGYTSMLDKSGPIGSPRSFTAYGYGWANASNTPFRRHKSSMFEGGVRSPLVIRWPDGIGGGSINRTPAHVIDWMPTAVALAGAAYPRYFEGRRITPMEGLNLMDLMQEDTLQQRPIFWEHFGHRAVLYKGWKLVAYGPEAPWELYHVAEDPAETEDVSGRFPGQLDALKELYASFADHAGVITQDIVREAKE